MELVTVVNRTSGVLQGTWGGRHYDIKPGESSFPVIQAEAFRRQNPVMGSEDPRTGKMDYLIGIKEYNHPITPIEQNRQSVERWDRSKLQGAKPSEVVPGDNGLYSARDVHGSLPFDANFTKP